MTAPMNTENEEIAYDENIDGHHVQLLRNGTFLVDNKDCGKWEDQKTKRPWIPVKRKNFMSLAKQYLRD